MDEASLVGGVLYNAADSSAAAEILARYLVSHEPDPRRLQDLGIEQTLVEALQRALPPDPAAILRACMKGAGWVLGHRSAERIDRWELVASLPATVHLPKGLRRITAETLVALVTQAEQSLLLTAPYVDVVAMEFLLDSLTAATERGVNVEIFEPKNWEPGPPAIAKLRMAVNQSGDLGRLRISRMSSEAPALILRSS